jgi:integrase
MLNNTQVKNLKPKDKLYRIADSNGLAIEVNPNGSKLWRYRYRFYNKATMMTLWSYPKVSLLDARQARDNNKQLLKKGVNPQQTRAQSLGTNPTFKDMFKSWYNIKIDGWTEGYAEDTMQRANNYLMPIIGNTPIGAIKTPVMRDLLLRIQDKGLLDMILKVKGIASGVFSFSVGMGFIDVNPVRDLPNDIFKKKPNKHYATITDPKEIGWLLNKLEQHQGSFEVHSALLLAPHLFVRPGELTGLLWSEVDFDAKLIRISAKRMKMEKQHIVPMSKQVLKVLQNLSNVNSDSEYVFPSQRDRSVSITTASLLASIRRLDIGKDKFTTHGFRHMASTRLNELGYRGDLIELQLAHTQSNKVRAAYNHAEYLDERRDMIQAWSDYLDKLRKHS